MSAQLREPVSVSLIFDHHKRQVYPNYLKRQHRLYRITTIGLHHYFRQGRTLIHVFSVSDGTTFFRLEFNTNSLHWELTASDAADADAETAV